MGLAIRRHHERRIKAKFRKIVVRWLFPWNEDRAGFVQRTSVRRAHHPKCPCGLCKRDRYNRADQRKLDRKEIDMSTL